MFIFVVCFLLYFAKLSAEKGFCLYCKFAVNDPENRPIKRPCSISREPTSHDCIIQYLWFAFLLQPFEYGCRERWKTCHLSSIIKCIKLSVHDSLKLCKNITNISCWIINNVPVWFASTSGSFSFRMSRGRRIALNCPSNYGTYSPQAPTN